jgi:hypothetical protein
MLNPISSLRRLLLLSLGLALVAGNVARAQTDSVQPAAPVAPGQDDDLKTCPYSQRSDFTVAMSRAAAKLDALIVPLTKRQKGGIAGGADAITLEDLQSSRTQLGHQISKIENVTPEDWVALRDAVLAALLQTQDAYEKAAKEYNNQP